MDETAKTYCVSPARQRQTRLGVRKTFGPLNGTAIQEPVNILLEGGQMEHSFLEHNLTHANGGRNVNSRSGPVGLWAWDACDLTIQFSEPYGNRTGNSANGGGFHLTAWRAAKEHEMWNGNAVELNVNPGVEPPGGTFPANHRQISASPLPNAGLRLTALGVTPEARDPFGPFLRRDTAFDVGFHAHR